MGVEDDVVRLREEWIELHNQGKKEEASAFYWEELFPLVRKSFRWRCKEYAGRYDALIMTVGTTPQPLILTLDVVRPTRVLFIFTGETSEHLARVIKEVDFLRSHEVQYDREKVDPDDPEEIYEKIGWRWQEWSREGGLRCALDNTGGKKSMVSAAAAAANFLGLDLLYVDHEKYLPDLRAPLPGTEYLTCLPNPYITLGDLKIRQCLDLFNAASFEAARKKLEEARAEIKGKRALPVVTKVKMLLGLLEGFSLWDRFHFKRAQSELANALETARRFDMDIDLPGLEKNMLALEVLGSEERGSKLFSAITKSPEFGLHLAVDLYCNAARKERAGAPDDAVVRLYRCLELISQLRLADRGYNTEKFAWDKLEPAVKVRYGQLARQVFGSENVKEPRDVGVMHGHLLLAALGDPLWGKEGEEAIKAFHGTVNKRNDLLLIHGKKRARPQDVEEFTQHVFRLLDRLMRVMGKDLEDLLDQHTFITL